MKKITYAKCCLLLVICMFLPMLDGQEFAARAKEFMLANGMKFYVYERHEVPTFAGMIMAKVGSVDEESGETGLAHFFEHLAFKGTPVIGSKDFAKERIVLAEIDKAGEAMVAEYRKGQEADAVKMARLTAQLQQLHKEHRLYVEKEEFKKIYRENGGKSLNATTGNDTTQYFIVLPSNRLELWFLMESERFKFPSFREFYVERDVIAEERRMSSDNTPVRAVMEEFDHLAFLIHPYRHPVIGYMEDIQGFTKAKALQFYQKFYNPNNLAAAVVGDVKFEEVKRLAEKYFGEMAPGMTPPRTVLIEPKQKGERRFIVELEAEPKLFIGYHIPNYPAKEAVTLNMISIILGGGASSRLVREIVTQKKLAHFVNIQANTDARYPLLFFIFGEPVYPHTPEELEAAIYAQLAKLQTEPVSAAEIATALNQIEATLYYNMDNNLAIARRILWGAVLFNDIDMEFHMVEAMKKVTPSDIMETAKSVLTANNRTVGILRKKEVRGAK